MGPKNESPLRNQRWREKRSIVFRSHGPKVRPQVPDYAETQNETAQHSRG